MDVSSTPHARTKTYPLRYQRSKNANTRHLSSSCETWYLAPLSPNTLAWSNDAGKNTSVAAARSATNPPVARRRGFVRHTRMWSMRSCELHPCSSDAPHDRAAMPCAIPCTMSHGVQNNCAVVTRRAFSACPFFELSLPVRQLEFAQRAHRPLLGLHSAWLDLIPEIIVPDAPLPSSTAWYDGAVFLWHGERLLVDWPVNHLDIRHRGPIADPWIRLQHSCVATAPLGVSISENREEFSQHGARTHILCSLSAIIQRSLLPLRDHPVRKARALLGLFLRRLYALMIE
mmetsp:Transcript_62967/g.140200  ORF Transcript_62967/g.140200 Transcript_62967/m.140200 type:complete len:287 (-) Transcript_62967:214-1074(-)